MFAQGEASRPSTPGPGTHRAGDVRLLLAVGAGEHLATRRVTNGGDEGAVAGALGVRARLWRAVVGEVLVHGQAPFVAGSGTLRCEPIPVFVVGGSCRTRMLAPQAAEADVFAAALSRVGVEHGLGKRGPLVRLTAGGGRMWEIDRAFGSAALGLSTRGRRLRATIDAERWWYRLPTTLEEYRPRATGDELVVLDRRAVAATSTFVRVGVEVPVGGWR